MSRFNSAASSVQELAIRLVSFFNKGVGTDNLTNDSVTKDIINSNVAGVGLEQNVNGSLQLKDDGLAYANLPMAIYNMIYEVGYVMEHPWNDLPTYGTWLWLDDRNIGDSSSGATARANDDVLTLFTKIWTDYTNTTAPIYTSAGAASTRGANAADDWSAHKRISLPKRQGRVLVAMDNYGEGGSAAGAITGTWADTLGTVAGEEKHQLTVAELAVHSHTYVRLTTPSGSGAATGSWDNWAPYETATSSAGSGTAHNIVQPSVTTKYIIRY